MRRLLAFLAIAVALASTAGARAVNGEQRLLIMLVTWGPQPVTPAEARAVLQRADAYERSASYGAVSLGGDVVGWLPMPRVTACDLAAIESAGRAGAVAAGRDPSRYERLVFVFPQNDCPWGGAYFGGDVWANGYFTDVLLEHELGHLFGTQEEGPAWLCDAGACHAENYASPYSVMGHGSGHYSAYEKSIYGWLRPTQARSAGTYALEAIERRPSALRVVTAADDYWFEFRSEEPGSNLATQDLRPTRGVVLHAGVNGLSDRTGVFPARDVYVPVNGKAALQTGERYVASGAFSLTVSSIDDTRATVAFRWTDAKKPGVPRILSVRPDVAWTEARDGGSGVGSYLVALDGKRFRTVAAAQELGTFLAPATLRARLPRVARGPHRVTVVAVDRAGNRSAPAVRTFRAR